MQVSESGPSRTMGGGAWKPSTQLVATIACPGRHRVVLARCTLVGFAVLAHAGCDERDTAVPPGAHQPYLLQGAAGGPRQKLELTSPGDRLSVTLSAGPVDGLTYAVRRGAVTIVHPSPLGIVVDREELGDDVEIDAPTWTLVDRTYPVRGVKRIAREHGFALVVPVRQRATGRTWTLEVRIYDEGVAFRYVVPGPGAQFVQRERTAWRVPPGSSLWYQSELRNYEGIHQHAPAAAIPAATPIGLPVTLVLADGSHAALTEAHLEPYSGLSLVASGTERLTATFADDPDGFAVHGTVRSPWRVIMAGPDLNALVNGDLVNHLAAPPDPALFPRGLHEPWIRPGRALWHWWSGTFGDLEGVSYQRQRWWIDHAARLGFEHYLVDAGWEQAWEDERGDRWQHLRELTTYARKRGVSLWLWKRWSDGVTEGWQMRGIERADERRQFFRRLAAAGAVGVKVDFMDSESVARNRFYMDTLRDAAEARLLVNFHGANKPVGESVTWPNELTREAVAGLEENSLVSRIRGSSVAPVARQGCGTGLFLPRRRSGTRSPF
jgi:alpha-glucosidase